MELTVAGKRVVIVGFGASGEAAARLCVRQGAARVVLNDKRDAADIKDAKILGMVREGVSLDLGAHRADTFANTDLVVVSPGVPPLDVLTEVEERGVPVISEIELASWFIDAPILAVTGTNGKSTVTSLIGEILKESGYTTFTGGNLGTPLCDAVGTAATRADGRVVVEVSSFQLERILYFRPAVAVYLNATPDHLDRYTNFAEYAATKARVFMNQSGIDHAVVPADDPVVSAFARAYAAKVHTYGGEQSPVRIAGESIVGVDGTQYPLAMLKIKGTHNVSNAMAAVLAAHLGGATPEATFSTLASFRGLAHRMQFVLEDKGVVYYDDSKATNVGAAVKAIEGLERRVVLIAGGRDKGGSYEPLVQLLRVKARAVVLLGEAAPLIKDALGASVPHRVADDMFDAVRIARMLAEPGDCVLLAPACSSLDMFENYAERGRVFAAAVKNLAENPSDRETPLNPPRSSNPPENVS